MLELLPNNPIVNDGLLYVNGLQIFNTGTSLKTLFLNPGAARDSKNVNDIILSSSVMINGARVGTNGVDTAPLGINKFYAVYVIGDSTSHQSPAGLLSLSSSSPTLPVGYDMSRRVGWILTDGSANILNFWQYGTNEQRMYYYDVAINALLNGSQTSPTVIDLSSSVPPISTEVLFQVTYMPNSALNSAQFLTFGAISPSSVIAIFGYGVVAPQHGMITVPAHIQSVGSPLPSILYQVGSGDTLTLLTAGYKDYL